MRCTRILLCGAALIAGHFSTAASAQPGAVFGDVTFGDVMVRAAASKILENKTQALAIFNKREEGNFRYGDWYVFCYRAETGEIEGDPAGAKIMDFRDPYDRPVGILIFEASPSRTTRSRPSPTWRIGRHLQNKFRSGKRPGSSKSMTLCAASAITFSWSGKRALILNRHALPRDAATWGAGQLPMAAPIRLGSKRRNKAIAPCGPYGLALVARIERSEMRGRVRLRTDCPGFRYRSVRASLALLML